MILRQQASWEDESLFDRPAQKDSAVRKKGISKSETARRFDVNRSTVGRYTPNMAIIVRVKRLLNTTHREIVAVY
jgi:hypothetical protein